MVNLCQSLSHIVSGLRLSLSKFPTSWNRKSQLENHHSSSILSSEKAETKLSAFGGDMSFRSAKIIKHPCKKRRWYVAYKLVLTSSLAASPFCRLAFRGWRPRPKKSPWWGLKRWPHTFDHRWNTEGSKSENIKLIWLLCLITGNNKKQWVIESWGPASGQPLQNVSFKTTL